MRLLLVIIIVATASFATGRFFHLIHRPTVEWEQAQALSGRGPRCIAAPSPAEQETFRLAVAVLENAGETSPLSLDTGAEKFLSHGLRRQNGESWISVCAPEDTYQRVSDAITKYQRFGSRLVEYQLELASKLPQPSPYIIEMVAKSAFSDTPQESESLPRRDIMPYARSVLAGLNADLSAWADRAFREISADNSLGTGAAQIAVAAGHPKALPRIEELMTELLSAIPKGDPVPWKTKYRLYELADAISLDRQNGQGYIGPLKDLMSRDVESFAPPFGMVPRRPKRICSVLERIAGKSALEGYDYCMDAKYVMDS